MDYTNTICEMLCIKPDEEFKLCKNKDIKDFRYPKYKLGKDMVVKCQNEMGEWSIDYTILPRLLTGEYIIKKIIIPTGNEQIAINYARLLGHNWIAKDEDGSIFAYISKPHKDNGGWSRDDCAATQIEYDISFISYSDSEPYYIGY